MAQKTATTPKKSLPKINKPSPSTPLSPCPSSSNSGSLHRKQIEFSTKEKTYFYGSLPGDDIEFVLQTPGDFVTRNIDEPTGGKVFVLTVRTISGGVKNYAIKFKNAEYFIVDKKAKSIHELLDLYVKQNIPILEDVFLKTPIHHPRWLLQHDDFRFGKKLGEGAFGEVYLSRYKLPSGEKCKMAVKTMHSKVNYESKLEFLKEARIMTKFEHQNIVRVFGVAVLGSPVIFAMEICPGGSLLNYLRVGKDQIPIPTKSRLAYESARGLAYLEKQGYLHRDIAARNCMLTRNLTVKVGDFGMSEQTSEMVVDKLEKVPIKWLAIETMQKRIYSHKTDVWSFGILLWEIYSNGEQPYVGYSNIQVRAKVVVQGYRMPVPPKTPDAVGSIMKSCWLVEPSQRPTFAKLEHEIQKYAEPPPKVRKWRKVKKSTKRDRNAATKKKEKSLEEKAPATATSAPLKAGVKLTSKDSVVPCSKDLIKDVSTTCKETTSSRLKKETKNLRSKDQNSNVQKDNDNSSRGKGIKPPQSPMNKDKDQGSNGKSKLKVPSNKEKAPLSKEPLSQPSSEPLSRESVFPLSKESTSRPGTPSNKENKQLLSGLSTEPLRPVNPMSREPIKSTSTKGPSALSKELFVQPSSEPLSREAIKPPPQSRDPVRATSPMSRESLSTKDQNSNPTKAKALQSREPLKAVSPMSRERISTKDQNSNPSKSKKQPDGVDKSK